MRNSKDKMRLTVVALFTVFSCMVKAGDQIDKKKLIEAKEREEKKLKQIPTELLKAIRERGRLVDINREVHYQIESEKDGKTQLIVFNQYGTLFKYRLIESVVSDEGIKQKKKNFETPNRKRITEKEIPGIVTKEIQKRIKNNKILNPKKVKYFKEIQYLAEIDEAGKTLFYIFDKNGFIISRQGDDCEANEIPRNDGIGHEIVDDSAELAK